MHKIGDTPSDLVIDKDSGDALGLIEDKLEIGIEVDLTLGKNGTLKKWDLVTDKKTGWMKIKKPNGFFLESSQNGNDLFIQGIYLSKVICVLGCANKDLWALCAPIFIIVVYCYQSFFGG